MNQGRHLWDALRDFLGLDGDAGAATPGDGRTPTAELQRLMDLNAELAASGARLRALELGEARAASRHAALLRDTLAASEQGDTDVAGECRRQAARAGGELRRLQGERDRAAAAHAALRQRRDVLITHLRQQRALPVMAAAEPTPAGLARPHDGVPAVSGSAALHERLASLCSAAAVSDLARRGLAQLDQLHAGCREFEALLDRKLSPGELTHSRFAAPVARLRDGLQARLEGLIDGLQVLRDIDPARLQAQASEAGAAGQAGLVLAITDRLALRDAELQRLERLLDANEEALNALLQASSAVAAMDTGAAAPGADLGALVADLEELATRAAAFT